VTYKFVLASLDSIQSDSNWVASYLTLKRYNSLKILLGSNTLAYFAPPSVKMIGTDDRFELNQGILTEGEGSVQSTSSERLLVM
jgi:hypothetical protein